MSPPHCSMRSMSMSMSMQYENLWVDVGGTKVWEENTPTMLGIQIENNQFLISM